MRQIVLDTETTGLEPEQGHRIIEIGCVELVNRRRTGSQYHQYVQPDRDIDEGAMEVHGITNEFLADKPRFADIAADFLEFIDGAELIIHNAPFDVGFMNNEIKLWNKTDWTEIATRCTVVDTLVLARQLHPGQRNSLDALCKRYGIDNSQRDLHGALLDAEILADVYLSMTGGQVSLSLERVLDGVTQGSQGITPVTSNRSRLNVIKANEEEIRAHESRLDDIETLTKTKSVWRSKNP